MKRRLFLQHFAAGAGALPLLMVGLSPIARAAAVNTIDVYKSPLCGCCEGWVAHLRDNGFTVRVHDVDDTGVHRARLGMPERYGSCHTASIGGYAIEGHVPAADIRRLLATRPKAVGLAVPGMPVGSPGMEQGPRVDPYQVLLVRADGGASVFARYPDAARRPAA